MLYCPKCQLLVNDDTQRCPVCSFKNLRVPNQDDPVLLITASEEKAEMIRAAFQEKGIVFEERISGIGGPPASILGKQTMSNINFFVRYIDLHPCEDVVRGIGILDASDAKQQSLAEKQNGGEPALEDAPEEMSARRRFFIRAISAIAFIFIVWGVVAFADWAAEALKALFTR